MKVLIVSDRVGARLALSRAIQSLGNDVIVAANGAEAWSVFPSSGADVVICDWELSGLDRLELTRRIRSFPGSAYPYIVVIVSRSESRNVVSAIETGADDFLVEPIDQPSLASGLIAAERVVQLHREIKDQREELERANLLIEARRDPLTMLGSRRRLEEDLAVLVGRTRRYGHTYVAALCDIDHFTMYNDAFGSAAGDEVLTTVARVLAARTRQGDMVYRHGGAEFLVVLPEQTAETAGIAMERIRGAIEQLGITHPGNMPPGVITLSVGIAELGPDDVDTAEPWLGRAQAALERAKSGGRNRIELDARPSRTPAA